MAACERRYLGWFVVQRPSPLVELLHFFQDFVFDLRWHEGKLLGVDVDRVGIVVDLFLKGEIEPYLNIDVCKDECCGWDSSHLESAVGLPGFVSVSFLL